MTSDAASTPSRRADIVSGGIWVVLGVAIMIGSWRMDRLESQGVPWFTAPGLVPGILGVLMTITALGIVLRALRASAAARASDADAESIGGKAVLTLVLCLGFAIGLVGRGVPFWVAAASYLFLHVFLLQLDERRARNEVARGAAVAAAIAIIAAAAISYVFQEVFLVRLP
ncbi:MAG TPA: tripartite tricarboxylate transporter TctB family protein [Casimicrobiaceae bacterium]|nr:tripartite tricarboxylate transporter TctB family protein [Casimicrobiaceae bacterium]